ncbi:MAG: CHC2 zinc finger domain-containing protein, partial [Parcubacteria group bacterium]
MGSNVETIKDRLDIVEVISPYLKLEKAGANLKARCPFHNEKTPSFFISPARQGYYCFGCGAKGDIFTFVEEMEGTDFKGALTILADKAGVELRPETPRDSKEREHREKLLSVLEAATSFFEAELKKTPTAEKYLRERGVSEESAKIW